MADAKLSKLDNPAAYFRQDLANRYLLKKNPLAAVPPPLVKAMYATQQMLEAEQYYKELDQPEQAELVERYNQQQNVPGLQLSCS